MIFSEIVWTISQIQLLTVNPAIICETRTLKTGIYI